MTFQATGLPNPGSGEKSIQTAGFFPAINLSEFRTYARVDHTVDDDRSAYQLMLAVAHVNRQLIAWKASAIDAGATELDADQQTFYKAAVFHHAKARLLEQYRDIDSRHVGTNTARDPSALADRVDTEWREVRRSIAALTGRAQTTVELI